MEADLDVLHRAKRPVQHERVADLGSHGVADAFFFAALRGMRPGRVPEHDPHGDARAAFIGENPEDASVLGKEQRAVSQVAISCWAGA